MSQEQEYPLYKGLQRPLVFKAFKGRFIYWAMGSIMSGIVIGGAVSALISSVMGIVLMISISIPLLMYTLKKQKEGLYVKRRDKAIFILRPQYHLKDEKEI